jgi:hypothetical protein
MLRYMFLPNGLLVKDLSKITLGEKLLILSNIPDF